LSLGRPLGTAATPAAAARDDRDLHRGRGDGSRGRGGSERARHRPMGLSGPVDHAPSRYYEWRPRQRIPITALSPRRSQVTALRMPVPGDQAAHPAPVRHRTVGRLLPLALLAVGLALFFLAGGHEGLNFDELARNRAALQD